jgi:predicted DNA-binding transcriptional regulator YafY
MTESFKPPAEFFESDHFEVGESADPGLRSVAESIRTHHRLIVDYVDAKGEELKLTVDPYKIFRNSAGHLVAWVWRVDKAHWEQLRADRIKSVVDSGEVFEPVWHD